MNAKKALTIGILAITAIGLVGCATILNKYKDQYQPKTLDVYADYYISSYTDETNYSFTGNSNYTYVDGYYYPEFNYTLKVTNLDKKLTINLTQIMLNGEWFNILTQNNNSFTLQINKELKYLYITPTGITSWDEENYSKYVYRFYVQYKYLDDTYSTSYAKDINITTEDMTINPYYDNIIEHEEIIDIQQNITTLKYTYDTGYTTGYQLAGDISDGNFLSLKNLMLNILTMPFTFINQAFNLTLWEGTAHSFNVGLFIRTIIAISAILFIIRMFTSGFSLLGNYTGGFTDKRLDRQQKKANIAKTKAETAKIEKKDK